MDKEKEITETVTDRDTSEKNTTETKEDSIRRDYGFAPDVELKECRYCRVMIPKKAKVCPNCRMSLKRHWFRNLVAAVFAVAVIGVGGYYLSDHWGIMRDAVMSVWMAQDKDNNAVSTVSVSTVDTAEMAAGAAQAGPSEVAVNKETSEKTDMEETAKSETEAARDNIAETEKKADSSGTSADMSGQAQNKTTGGKQSDSNMASSKEDNTADMDELTADKAKGEKATENKVTEDKSTEDEETTSDSGTAKNAAGNNAGTVSGGKDNNDKDNSGKNDNGKDNSDKDNNDKEKSDINSNGKEKNDIDSNGKERSDNSSTDKDNDKGNNSNDDNNNSKIDGYDEESRQASGETAAAGNDSTQQEQAFRDDCIEVSYKALLRDSETYLNTALKVEVQVVSQVMGGLFDDNIYYLCKVEGVSGIERYYIIRDDREEDDTLILEGDTLTVYGELFGSCKLPASLIETRPTVPAVAMLYFDLKEE